MRTESQGFLSFWVQRRISLFKPPRFFTPLHSVQNDINIHCLLSLLQKCLSTEILLIYPRESGGTGFRACANKGLNLSDIILIFFIKMILKPETLLMLHRPSTGICTGWKACATSLRWILQVPLLTATPYKNLQAERIYDKCSRLNLTLMGIIYNPGGDELPIW